MLSILKFFLIIQPGKGQTSSSTEFDNIWKQLQSTQPPVEDNSNQGLSLSSAAAVLPRVPSPDTASNKGHNSNQNATKIDVQSLFSGASSVNDIKTIQPGKQIITDNKAQSKVSKVVSNDEFAAMFKSLEEVHISKEENEKKSEVFIILKFIFLYKGCITVLINNVNYKH